MNEFRKSIGSKEEKKITAFLSVRMLKAETSVKRKAIYKHYKIFKICYVT